MNKLPAVLLAFIACMSSVAFSSDTSTMASKEFVLKQLEAQKLEILTAISNLAERIERHHPTPTQEELEEEIRLQAEREARRERERIATAKKNKLEEIKILWEDMKYTNAVMDIVAFYHTSIRSLCGYDDMFFVPSYTNNSVICYTNAVCNFALYLGENNAEGTNGVNFIISDNGTRYDCKRSYIRDKTNSYDFTYVCNTNRRDSVELSRELINKTIYDMCLVPVK